MTEITVFGIGGFGTTPANVLAENGHDILMQGKNQEAVDELNTCHTNKKYLKYAKLDANTIATPGMTKAIQYTDIYLMTLSIRAIQEVAIQINDRLTSKRTFIHAAKGTEDGTFKHVSEMVEDSISPEYNAGIGALSGPSRAEEVVVKQPTTVAASSKDKNVSKLTQDLFMSDYLRVYTNNDLIGVELGSALKNIITVASDIVAGISYGDNAKAALMIRGLAEISKSGEKLGTDPMTFLGLGGIGDLIVTYISTHPRDFTLEYKLGQGESMDQALSEMNIVVEGIYAAKSVYHLAKEENVDIPIANASYRVLFENISIKEYVKNLMEHNKKSE